MEPKPFTVVLAHQHDDWAQEVYHVRSVDEYEAVVEAVRERMDDQAAETTEGYPIIRAEAVAAVHEENFSILVFPGHVDPFHTTYAVVRAQDPWLRRDAARRKLAQAEELFKKLDGMAGALKSFGTSPDGVRKAVVDVEQQTKSLMDEEADSTAAIEKLNDEINKVMRLRKQSVDDRVAEIARLEKEEQERVAELARQEATLTASKEPDQLTKQRALSRR